MTTLQETANLAASLAEDSKAAERVRAHEMNTRLVGMLVSLRASKKLSQRQLAKKMGVDASKVSRMEAGSDDQLRWGDVLRYMRALGVNASLLVDDPSLPAAERIKHHVLTAHKLLEQLRALAHDLGHGEEITAKIKEFYGEVLFNFMLRFCDSYVKFPQAGPVNVTSESDESDAESSAAPECRQVAAR